MNSDSGLAFGIAIFCAALALIIFTAIILTPMIAVAGVPVAAYLYYRNSPATKEKQAHRRTAELYEKAMAFAPPDYEKHMRRIGELDEPVAAVALELYEMEGFAPPPQMPPVSDSVEGARYRDRLIAYMDKASDPKGADGFMRALLEVLPQYDTRTGLFEATAWLTNNEIEELILPFYGYDDYFRKLKTQLDRNYNEQRGIMPSAYKGENCAFAYLKDTPLLALERRQFGIYLKNRTEHHHIVAGSGWGKTSLLQYMIHNDLESDCCVVVIDNQRQMIEKLAMLDLPVDQVALISPHNNVGINLFDVPTGNEEEINAAVDLLEYIIGGLLGAEFTAKQAPVFQYALQLAVGVPGMDIRGFVDLLRAKDIGPYEPHLAKLDETVQAFMRTEFAGSYKTRDEIGWRIWSIMKNPTFRRMFLAPRNSVNMFEELRSRKLILIDTDINLLKESGSSFLGRFFVAQILQAAQRRFKGYHRPVFLYIDECPLYFDDRLELMLQQARKANIGMILAHQDFERARRSGILSALLGNTEIKFAGRLNDTDARTMAANMNTDHQFIRALPRYHFACHMTGDPVYAITGKEGVVETAPKRDNPGELVAEMDRRYGYALALPSASQNAEPEAENLPEKEPVRRTNAPGPDDDLSGPYEQEEIVPSGKL